MFPITWPTMTTEEVITRVSQDSCLETDSVCARETIVLVQMCELFHTSGLTIGTQLSTFSPGASALTLLSQRTVPRHPQGHCPPVEVSSPDRCSPKSPHSPAPARWLLVTARPALLASLNKPPPASPRSGGPKPAIQGVHRDLSLHRFLWRAIMIPFPNTEHSQFPGG